MNYETRERHQVGLVDKVNKAIRDNPLAAGLIGAGLCWMLFSKVKPSAVGGITEALKGAADSVGAAASAGGSSVASAASKAGSQIAEAAGHVKDTATDTLSRINLPDAPSIVAEADETVRTALRSSAEAGKRYGTKVQHTLSETLERQPLLLGAIGLAIGAGIASAFHSTQIENELMGEQGSAARAKLQDFAEETKDFAATRAKEVLDAVKDEAKAQGFTPEAAKAAFQDVSKKVKDVAGAAEQAVQKQTS